MQIRWLLFYFRIGKQVNVFCPVTKISNIYLKLYDLFKIFYKRRYLSVYFR